MKKTMDKNKKKKTSAEYSDKYQVPLHRSYGVKKKESVFTHLNDYIATVLLVILYVLQLTIWVLGAFWLTVMLGAIGTVIAVIVLVSFIWWKFFRVFRKRVKFLFKLKRTCKSLGFKIKFYRGFFKGLRFNKDGVDFTVDTGKKLWTVRFLPCKKYNTDLIFEDEKTIIMKINPIRFKGSLAPNMSVARRTVSTNGPMAMGKAASKAGTLGSLGSFKRSKVKQIEYGFTDMKEQIYRKWERALIINPVPHTILKKETDGAIYETGTGEKMWGYTAFSGSGFINMLKNESRE